jgi:hypothetical protein
MARWIMAVVSFVAVAGPARAAGTSYPGYKAWRIFAPDKGHPNPFGKSDVLAADFLTTGFSEPDGSDIRVFLGRTRRPADFRVMLVGPGDRARVAIRMVRGVDEYTVCYGGPKRRGAGRWEPEVGLTLETRKFNGGHVRNLKQMLALVKKSGPSYGTWLVPNIFHGLNPYGPSDSYVSIYRGRLHVPKAGTYRFATTSDDASFFLVNDTLVSAKPRWGRGPANARFAGRPVRLDAGAHDVTYLHVEGQDTQFCVGAWQPPGEKFQLIPPGAFPGVFRAKQVGLVLAGSRVPVDLTWRADGEVLFEEHHLYKVRFRDVTQGRSARAYERKWFFGDGTSSEERHPEHVYFRPGEFTVTFALVRGGAVSKIRQTIVIGADWEHQGQRRRRDTAARYYELVKGYEFRTMHSVDLAPAFEFFVSMDKDDEIMKVAAALLGRDDDAARALNYRCAVHLGERLRDLRALPEEALVVLRAALKRETDETRKAKLVRRIGDTLLYALRKPKEALAEYHKVLNRYGKLEDNVVRLAQIRAGDAYKALGEAEQARATYRKAKGMLTYQRSHTVSSVRQGAFAQSIEGYLQRKEYGQAQSLVDLWGWEHPEDRMEGEWSLMAAKVALARGDSGSALREALECAAVNPAGPHADRLLLFAARVHLERREGAEAVEVARRLQKTYPESALQQDAALVECRGLLSSKTYYEATKHAAAAYGRYKKTEGAAAFLMVAAHASLASKDKERAVKLLGLIVKDHPQSDSAEAAQGKLKALGATVP